MDVKEIADKPEKKYSYLIFVLICLALIAYLSYEFDNSGPDPKYDYTILYVKLVQMFVASTLAWLIGKKYRLNYPLMCGICGGVFTAFTSLRDIIGTIVAGSFDLEIFLVDVVMVAVGFLFIGGIVLAVSYPFQYPYFKISSYLKEREFPK